jgi:hypothetical protein
LGITFYSFSGLRDKNKIEKEGIQIDLVKRLESRAQGGLFSG